MSATGFIRGHAVTWENDWRYVDTGEVVPVPDVRSCSSCGKPPTSEGYDACLGFIPHVKSACCGHGHVDAYIRCSRHDWSLNAVTSGPGWQTHRFNAKCSRCGKVKGRWFPL